MKIVHTIIIAIVLIVAGIGIAMAGLNGITNTASNLPAVQEVKKPLSSGDAQRQLHYGSKIAEPAKPMNPFVIPVMEFMGGIGFVAGGAYLVAGNAHLPKKTPTQSGPPY